MNRRIAGSRIALVAVTVTLLAGGCGTSTAGNPSVPSGSAVSSGTSPVGSPLPSTPPVSTPLSVSRIVSDPCSLLTGTQLGVVGLTAAARPTPNHDPIGVGCAWNDRTVGTTGAQTGYDLETGLVHGLRDIYVQKQQMAYWQPVTVDGYPAVFDDPVDQRADGTCRMDLAVSEKDVLLVDYQGDPGVPACDKAKALGGALITSLKGGA
jgi:Protein of unknown function (DUF3558)